MARPVEFAAKRPRISVDVVPEVRRVRLAAAKRDVTVRRYVLEAIKERLREDLGDDDEISALTRATDPVLADVWDNVRDSAYDRPHVLSSRQASTPVTAADRRIG
jgi:hypothetical protein